MTVAGGAWPALQAARACDPTARLPFCIGADLVGSVARQHLAALTAWPQWLQLTDAQVALTADAPTAALAHINAGLRAQGLISGWRDEPFAIVALQHGRRLAGTERAAARFWGTLTLGAHANGYVADAAGRPTHLWIAQRAANKSVDPGLHDNLVGGGVADGQTPWQTLLREGFEEAGLAPAQMAAARPGRVLRLQRDVTEGLQLEDLHGFDLALPPGLQPHNQDGEVQRFDCLPLADALTLAAGGTMTVDAALVTLDFALRHRLLPAAAAAALAARMAPLLTAPLLVAPFAAADSRDQTA